MSVRSPRSRAAGRAVWRSQNSSRISTTRPMNDSLRPMSTSSARQRNRRQRTSRRSALRLSLIVLRPRSGRWNQRSNALRSFAQRSRLETVVMRNVESTRSSLPRRFHRFSRDFAPATALPTWSRFAKSRPQTPRRRLRPQIPCLISSTASGSRPTVRPSGSDVDSNSLTATVRLDAGTFASAQSTRCKFSMN